MIRDVMEQRTNLQKIELSFRVQWGYNSLYKWSCPWNTIIIVTLVAHVLWVKLPSSAFLMQLQTAIKQLLVGT